MVDLSTTITSVGVVGAATFVQQFVKWIRDERRSQRAERSAAEQAPLNRQAAQLGMVDRVTHIQGDLIDELRAGSAAERARHAAEVKDLRRQLRERDEEIRRLRGMLTPGTPGGVGW